MVTKPIWRFEAGEEARPRAALVADQVDFIETKSIEQPQEVADPRLEVVPARWGAGPSESPLVKRPQLVVIRETINYEAPGVPVLREPVQQDDRSAVPGFGDMNSDAIGMDVAVTNSRHHR
jgi:hypothetical protein